MTFCMNCGESTVRETKRCERCTDKELAKIALPSVDPERYADVLGQLTKLYIMGNIELPRQAALNPDWTDHQIAEAAIKAVESVMNDPERVERFLLSDAPQHYYAQMTGT